MIEDKIIVNIYINKYFSYLNENERNEMVKKIFSFGPESKIFIQMFNNNVTKIGVKYMMGTVKCKFYYSTIFDSEILDLWNYLREYYN